MLECFYKFDMQAARGGGVLIANRLMIGMIKCWFWGRERALEERV